MRHLPDHPSTPASPSRALPRPAVSAPSRRASSAALVLPALAIFGSLVAAGLAVWVSGLVPEVAREPALATLLRAMAGIKGFFVLCALALVAWRARYPLAARYAAVYVGACWVAAGAAALIGQLAFVPAAALAFHVAEISFVIAAWRDGRALRTGGSCRT